MRDVTSGHLRSSGRTEHLCLGLLGTLWFTRGRLPPGPSDTSTGKHLFVSFLLFAGPTWAIAARAPPLPFGLGIKVS